MEKDLFKLTLSEIEQKVCDIAAECLTIPRAEISPQSRVIEDLHCDSIELIELITELEGRQFGVTIPNGDPNPVCKAIFSRKHFRLIDLAEVIYLQRGTGTPKRSLYRGYRPVPEGVVKNPFCQLGGRHRDEEKLPLFERLRNDEPFPQFRRHSDGMRCILLPAATVEIGTDSTSFDHDSRPRHVVQLDSFLIDSEPVSTTAYCRFLNSIRTVQHDDLMNWFLLTDDDDRTEHVLIELTDEGWRPVRGCEKWPMILVSWYGANAYSIWANGKNWRNYRRAEASFLPSEAQWEYAARGSEFRLYPWGDEPPTDERMRFGLHAHSEAYSATTLPLAAVNEQLGMSPFGLHHMAGNVWQWCRDCYDDDFYSKPEASTPNAFCRTETGIRSERGGSWVGPADLCRCSYRRGREPNARGRCLGFRCISDVSALQ